MLILLCGLGEAAQAECRADQVSIRGPFGKAEFQVEIADTNETRSKGLMFRENLARFAGMLFVYERPQRAVFWMKNTPLPLDMIFVNANGQITVIKKNTVPFSLDQVDGGKGVLAVLEVNGGTADMLGLAAGDQMRHPAFQDEPVWPCN